MPNQDFLKQLFSQPQRREYVSGQNFYIGDGGLSFRDKFIPFHAISYIDIKTTVKSFNKKWLLGILVGLLLLAMGNILFIVIGLCCAGGSIWIIYNQYIKNKYSHYLVLEINSGRELKFSHHEVNFLYDVKNALQKGINDEKAVSYIDMRQGYVEQNVGVIEQMKEKNVINIGDNNQFTGSNFGNNNTANVNDNHVQVTLLSETEWDTLREYFAKQKAKHDTDTKEYEVCVKLEEYAKKEDKNGLQNYIKNIGTSVFKAVLGNTLTAGVLEILKKILK